VPEETIPAKPPWKFDRIVAAEGTGLLLLPLLAFWVMRFIPINQNHFLDPYLYTGYIHNFQDLMTRYGLTYYSVRFGLIVPAQWFARLFGPEGGYFTFRYVLVLLAAGSLYYAVKRQFSQPVAILTVVGMVTSPYFARAVLWDHPDASGVPFLTAAVCLVLVDQRPSWWRDALAGACAAMAVNSNFFEVSLVAIFGVAWLLFSLAFRQPLKEVLKRIAGMAAGGCLVSALGCLYYWHALGGITNIFAITIRMASSLARGGTKQWRTPGAGWIAAQLQVLIPVLLTVCCVLVARWRRMSFASSVVVAFGLFVTTFYYVEQFLLDSDVLQLFYYFSYFMPAVFLMLAFLWQNLWERTERGAVVFIGVGLAALLAPWMLVIWSRRALPNPAVSHWLVLAGAAAVAVHFATRESRWPVVQRTLPWIALVLLTGSVTAGLSGYGTMLRTGTTSNNAEMDVYRVALQFVRTVPKVADHSGAILFWYKNRNGSSINSVQSTYLWGYSKLNRNPPADPGLPYLDESQLQTLRLPQLQYLSLLCESEEELSQGLAALARKSVAFRTADSRVLSSGGYRIYYELIELIHDPVVPR